MLSLQPNTALLFSFAKPNLTLVCPLVNPLMSEWKTLECYAGLVSEFSEFAVTKNLVVHEREFGNRFMPHPEMNKLLS